MRAKENLIQDREGRTHMETQKAAGDEEEKVKLESQVEAPVALVPSNPVQYKHNRNILALKGKRNVECGQIGHIH